MSVSVNTAEDERSRAELRILLSERETMRALGIGRSLLRRIWAQGLIRPTRLGRRLLFHVDEVRRFADEVSREGTILD